MIKVRCTDSWTAQLTEGKEYEVYDIHNQYYLIVDDLGRLCYEYCKNFTQAVGEHVKMFDMKFKTNWEVFMRLSKEEYKEVLTELKLLKKSIESVNYNYTLTDIIVGDIMEQINDEIEQIKQFIEVAV